MEGRNRNNTRALQKQISKLLSKAEFWLVLRKDKEGVHLDMPNENHMLLFGVFFAHNPELFEIVKEFIKEYESM